MGISVRWVLYFEQTSWVNIESSERSLYNIIQVFGDREIFILHISLMQVS